MASVLTCTSSEWLGRNLRVPNLRLSPSENGEPACCGLAWRRKERRLETRELRFTRLIQLGASFSAIGAKMLIPPGQEIQPSRAVNSFRLRPVSDIHQLVVLTAICRSCRQQERQRVLRSWRPRMARTSARESLPWTTQPSRQRRPSWPA